LHTTFIYIQTRQYLVGINKVYQNFLFLVRSTDALSLIRELNVAI